MPRLHLVAAAVIGLTGALPALAQFQKPEDAVKYRQSAMFVMGDEFARSQDGHDNPYDIDSPLTWVDWGRLDQWRGLHDTVRHLLRLRTLMDHSAVHCFGVNGPPDIGYGSRSLAWATGQLYVVANAWWEPLSFHVQTDGPWRLDLATSPDTRLVGATTVEVAPRSVAVLVRTETPSPSSPTSPPSPSGGPA